MMFVHHLCRGLHVACALPLVLSEMRTREDPSHASLARAACTAFAAFVTGKWMVRFQQSELGSWLLYYKKGKEAESEGDN